MLYFWNVNLGVYYKLKKKLISNQTRFFFKFELDFYCLCRLQKSILNSNWFFGFLNLIFRNWKKIEWHLIFQKSSGDRQGVCLFSTRVWLFVTCLTNRIGICRVPRSPRLRSSTKGVLVAPALDCFQLVNRHYKLAYTEGPRLTRFLGLGKNRVTWNSC